MQQGGCDVTKMGESKELGCPEKPVEQEQRDRREEGRMAQHEAGQVGGSRVENRDMM